MTATDTTSRAVAPRQAATQAPATLPTIGPEERALLIGDLSQLTPDQRATLVTSVCASLGLNPLTQPFAYIVLNSKLTLYARKDCTDQLRTLHGISLRVSRPEVIEDILYVTANASTPAGRVDEDYGAVYVGGLKGEARANALLKAITKSKRRVTLSICGLGMLDETEVETIPGAVRMDVAEEAPRTSVPALTASPAPAAAAPPRQTPGKSERQHLWEQITALRPDTAGKGLEGHLADIARDLAMQVHEHRDTIEIGYLRAMLDEITTRVKRPTRTVDTTTGEILDGEGAPAVEAAPTRETGSLPYVALLNKLNAAAALEPAARNAQVDVLVGNARTLLDQKHISEAEYAAVSARGEEISPVAGAVEEILF